MYLNKNNYPVEDWKKVDYLNQHYEFCYLESMHYFNMHGKTDTIITGLSFGVNGLESRMIGENTLNFSMHTQDLYYDYLHIKHAIENSKNISQCVLTLGYFSLYYDLSLSNNRWKCLKTYWPLFSDVHHLKEVELIEKYKYEYTDEIQKFVHDFFASSKSFYGKAIAREQVSKVKGDWARLSLSERDMLAFQIAEKHNKHIKYIETYKENVKIFKDILTLLNEHQIRTIVVILPFSKEYLRYINPIYKESIIHILENSIYSIDFIDMNEEIVFNEKDMQDSDHLSYGGAKKASLLVKGIIAGIL